MRKLFFIANHPAPLELNSEYEVIALSADEKSLWSNIPMTGVTAHVSPILAKVKSVVAEGGIIVAVGEPRACMIAAITAGSGNVFSTFSVRQSVDKPLPDGTVEKTSVFKFSGLVPYEF